ncbi:transcriptional regulator [Enterocloster clostridioformis]|nr:HxlR family transcriptional regulator [Lachnoclostridium sp. YL32]NDO31053.1 helix-turn-helix transcriptional regulator [Enterocloster clostridioformis]OXE66488.1 transcriptional regulator [Enterocloster clostridioformis]QQR03781.1 helix-turn-helix transcriptional regulator [Enterocloster clostridioformis]
MNLDNEEEFKKWLLSAQPDNNCPVSRALELFNGKWKTRILFELCKKDSLRFGELKKSIPLITNTMLSSTLKELENIDVVKRTQYNEIPPHVEYSLTEKGQALLPSFLEIAKWGEKYL